MNESPDGTRCLNARNNLQIVEEAKPLPSDSYLLSNWFS